MAVENRRNLGPAHRRSRGWSDESGELSSSVLPSHQLSQKLESIVVVKTSAVSSEQTMRQPAGAHRGACQ
jgi:hypothetical protein